MNRALVEQVGMLLVVDVIAQRDTDSRLADARLAGQQNDLSFTLRGFAPVRYQQSKFTDASDETSRARAGCSLVATE